MCRRKKLHGAYEEFKRGFIGCKSRVEKLEENFVNLKSDLSKTEYKVDVINMTTKETKMDVKKILERPVQYWDKLIIAGISGIVGYILSIILK